MRPINGTHGSGSTPAPRPWGQREFTVEDGAENWLTFKANAEEDIGPWTIREGLMVLLFLAGGGFTYLGVNHFRSANISPASIFALVAIASGLGAFYLGIGAVAVRLRDA